VRKQAKAFRAWTFCRQGRAESSAEPVLLKSRSNIAHLVTDGYDSDNPERAFRESFFLRAPPQHTLAPMSQPSLWERLRRARIVQVLVVYLGVSWGVLQIVEVVSGLVELPSWVGPVALLLLLIGLVVVAATALVQSLPQTTAREEAGEVPTDWQVAPADVVKSLSQGRIPHLTWGRAILGGVVALSLLFGGAGMWVAFNRTPVGIGPTPAGADESPAGLAIVPFDVTGPDLELWREGMVDLLATNLDGVGGLRTIDARTTLARWREQVTAGESPDLETALRVAAQTGARYALVGNLVGSPAGIRVSADIYDLTNREEVVQAVQEGPADSVIAIAGGLSVQLARDLIGSSGGDLIQPERMEAMTTPSLPALRAYLEGEAAYRRSDFATAVAAYERAVTQDSLFALAWFRLSDSYGWLEDIGSAGAALASDRSMALLDRLPARERILVEAGDRMGNGEPSYLQEMRAAVRRYPSDAEMWFMLGEFVYHVGKDAGMAGIDEAVGAFDRAIELAPRFGPYQVHAFELSVASGDRADAEARLARYMDVVGATEAAADDELVIPLLLGDSAEAAEAVARSLEAPVRVASDIRTAYTVHQDRWDRLFDLQWANRRRPGGDDHQWILYNLVGQGQLRRGYRLTDSLNVSRGNQGVALGFMLGIWSTAGEVLGPSAVTPEMCEQPAFSGMCHLFVGWGLARSGNEAGAQESLRLLRARASEAEGDVRRTIEEHADAVEGTIAAVRGDVVEARRLLRPLVTRASNSGQLGRSALAEVEWAEGNATDAIRYYEGNSYNYERPHVALELARIHDERGEGDRARVYYQRFLTITRLGDPDLPEIAEAREALERLGG
jgi:tetratricopeptide (TPR) repeat protein